MESTVKRQADSGFLGVDVQENPGGAPEAGLALPIRPLRITLSCVGSPVLALGTVLACVMSSVVQ